MGRFSMSNRIAVVTGGSRGLGRAIALAFAEAGAKVVIAARNVDVLHSVVKELEQRGGSGSYIKCDLSIDDDVSDLIPSTEKRYGKVDILVNNCAISPFVRRSEEVTKEMWEEVIQVNLLAPFVLCREAGKIMMRQNWGRIINIASAGGVIALPRQIAYCATKAALIQMTKVLAVEWAGSANITVNAIAPGYFSTDLTEGMRKSEKISKNLLQRNPTGRFGNVDEISNAALYLASEAASFTTGSVLVVDGGMLAS